MHDKAMKIVRHGYTGWIRGNMRAGMKSDGAGPSRYAIVRSSLCRQSFARLRSEGARRMMALV